MDNQGLNFKQSRIIQTYLLLVLVGFLMSCLPKGSLPLFLINQLIAIVSLLMFLLFWKKHKLSSKRYFSLLSFVMLLSLSIYAAIPFLRIYFGTMIFWMGLFILVAMTLLPHFIREKIILGIEFPGKTKLGIVLFMIFGIIISFGTIVYRMTLIKEVPDALPLAIFGYLIALMFLIICPILLIRPERVDELKKSKR
ncbi:hypothetical protein J6TS2_48860 [Heyndrickxia sporothermodurans]|nr:hypothetical protein J6TS2_48860 [Heyndrickxia sporothermodurans]